METDVQYGVQYDAPVRGGNEAVTRQRGLDPAQLQLAADPQPPKEIIQGDPAVIAYRNPGNGAQVFASDGTLHSDHRADDNTFFADHPLSDPDLMAPGIARTNLPLPPPPAFVAPAVQQPGVDREAVKAAAIAAGFIVNEPGVPPAVTRVFDVVQADEGSADPRDMSTGPQVLSALPVIKKAPIVPVVLPTPKVRRVKKGKK